VLLGQRHRHAFIHSVAAGEGARCGVVMSLGLGLVRGIDVSVVKDAVLYSIRSNVGRLACVPAVP
jgi:hypothetical protein